MTTDLRRFIAVEGELGGFVVEGEDIAPRYSPEQPRVPKGSDEGGEWTEGGNGKSKTENSLGVDLSPKGETPTPAARARLDAFEQQIAAEEHERNPNPGHGVMFGPERGMIVDQSGKVLWQGIGEANRIPQEATEKYLNPGHTLTHFHPDDSAQADFSMGDLNTSMSTGTAFRAFNSNGAWVQFVPNGERGGLFINLQDLYAQLEDKSTIQAEINALASKGGTFSRGQHPSERGGPQAWTKGEHGWFSGSKPGGPISPATMGDIVPAKGRQEIVTGDPTRYENLSPEFQAKILAKLQERFPGMTQEQLAANVDAQLVLALKDPSNNGMTWYTEAHDAVAAIPGYDLGTNVGGLAAMSPQQGWGSNLSGAQYMAAAIKANPLVDGAGLTPELVAEARVQLAKKGVTAGDWDGGKHLADLSSMEAAAYIKATAKKGGLTYVDDMNGKTYKVTWSCGLNGMEAAVRIYRGETPEDVLNGHKVRSFYNNILAGSESLGAVTIDTHALSAAVNLKVPAQDDRMDVLQTPKSRQLSGKGAYSLFADAYREVAFRHGLSPEQVQALVWIQWRKTNP